MKLVNIDKSIHHIDQVQRFIAQWKNNRSSITQQSSGSTGKPKEIEIPKWKMKASAQMTGDFFSLEQCKSALLCMSTQYIGGKMMVIRSIEYNLTLYATAPKSNPLENLTVPIDFAAMVPLQVETLLKESPKKLNLIKYLIIGGAPVSASLIRKLQDYSCTAYSTFGMTETVSHIALRKLKNENTPYRAIGNTRFLTQDNRLIIYCNDLKINGLKTTDEINLIDEKSFIWRGRTDFVINSGGVKIHPEKVEDKIQKKIPLENFIISKLPDPILGDKVIFIGEHSTKRPELKAEIENLLEKYERPKSYYFLSSLKKTPSGKIDRIKTTLAIQ